jgi:tRNA (cmo5U34)-methyltransferase
MSVLHEDFKRANGYSEREISQKRAALERVLIAQTAERHLQRPGEAGFPHAALWFQCLNSGHPSAISWTCAGASSAVASWC